MKYIYFSLFWINNKNYSTTSKEYATWKILPHKENCNYGTHNTAQLCDLKKSSEKKYNLDVSVMQNQSICMAH